MTPESDIQQEKARQAGPGGMQSRLRGKREYGIFARPTVRQSTYLDLPEGPRVTQIGVDAGMALLNTIEPKTEPETPDTQTAEEPETPSQP